MIERPSKPQNVFYSVARVRPNNGECTFEDLRAAKFMNPSSTGRIYRILNVVVSHFVCVYRCMKCFDAAATDRFTKLDVAFHFAA